MSAQAETYVISDLKMLENRSWMLIRKNGYFPNVPYRRPLLH